MTQGISSSLNLMLARLSSIESNFSALEAVGAQFDKNKINTSQDIEKQDFKTILDNKINEADKDFKELKTDDVPSEIKEVLFEDIDKTQEAEEKKEAVEFKSKVDLKSQSANIDEIIETFSNKYGVDGDFIKAIIKQESGFNPKATSKKGAMGLMQLMPKTAKSLGVADAYNPWDNIEGGVKHIGHLLKKYHNNEELALAAYNAGEGAVKRYGGIPPYKETQNYVNSIMASYNKLKEAKI